MQKQIPSYAAALMLALLLPIGACTKVENIPSPTPLVIKEGVKLSYTPKNGKELSELRDKELVPLIQKKIISVNEARAFMISQKKRLGLANPNRTSQFDNILKQKGLIN